MYMHMYILYIHVHIYIYMYLYMYIIHDLYIYRERYIKGFEKALLEIPIGPRSPWLRVQHLFKIPVPLFIFPEHRLNGTWPFTYVYILGLSARFARALASRYYGVILRNDITDIPASYWGNISRNYITESYHGILIQN